MGAIMGAAGLLSSGTAGPVNEAQLKYLNRMETNANRMALLISDLTDISLIESGRLHLELAAVSMTEVVEEVMWSARDRIERKNQTLTMEIPENLPLVWGDRVRLMQILTNLISNACKFTPPDGQIFVCAERTANRWNLQGPSEVVRVTVEDNGIGIRLEDQENIFQKFFRSEDREARKVPGTGLGLSIAKNLVEMQGGQIWLESEPREGTSFHFTVPVSEAAGAMREM
jgi:signal transduction histidine kinase